MPHGESTFRLYFVYFSPLRLAWKSLEPIAFCPFLPKTFRVTQEYPGADTPVSTQDQEYPGPGALVLRTRSTQKQDYLGAEVPRSDRRHFPLQPQISASFHKPKRLETGARHHDICGVRKQSFLPPQKVTDFFPKLFKTVLWTISRNSSLGLSSHGVWRMVSTPYVVVSPKAQVSSHQASQPAQPFGIPTTPPRLSCPNISPFHTHLHSRAHPHLLWPSSFPTPAIWQKDLEKNI